MSTAFPPFPVDLAPLCEVADEPLVAFVDAHERLSNFCATPAGIDHGGHRFPSVEHAYQFAKAAAPTAALAAAFQRATADDSKLLGRSLPLRADWMSVRAGLMLGLVRQKFRVDPKARAVLRATQLRPLIEGNAWQDNVWGVDPPPVAPRDVHAALARTEEGTANLMGLILMLVRAEVAHGAARAGS